MGWPFAVLATNQKCICPQRATRCARVHCSKLYITDLSVMDLRASQPAFTASCNGCSVVDWLTISGPNMPNRIHIRAFTGQSMPSTTSFSSSNIMVARVWCGEALAWISAKLFWEVVPPAIGKHLSVYVPVHVAVHNHGLAFTTEMIHIIYNDGQSNIPICLWHININVYLPFMSAHSNMPISEDAVSLMPKVPCTMLFCLASALQILYYESKASCWLVWAISILQKSAGYGADLHMTSNLTDALCFRPGARKPWILKILYPEMFSPCFAIHRNLESDATKVKGRHNAISCRNQVTPFLKSGGVFLE